MPDNISHGQFALYWLVDGAVLLLVFAPMGYLIATHKIRHPSVIFFTRFLGVFAVLFLADLLIMWFAPSFYLLLQGGLAALVTRALKAGGLSASSSGAVISLPSGSFKIATGCLGDELVCVYVALVLAERAATRGQYALGLLVGLVVLWAFNVLRIVVSIYTESRWAFNSHYVFYLGSLVFVLALWWIWLGRLRTLRATDTD